MFKPFRKNIKGFTLIEVLISITLLSLLMVYVFSIMDSSIKTKEDITEEDSDFMQIEMAFSRMALDFSQHYSPLFFSAIKKDEKDADNPYEEGAKYIPTDRFPKVSTLNIPIPMADNPEKTEFVFYSSSNRRKIQDSKQSQYGWVRYKLRGSTLKEDYLKRENGGQELVRFFEPDNIYRESFNWDKIQANILLRHIKDLKFFFWDDTKEDWVPRLRERSKAQEPLRMIKVVINWIDKNGTELEFERVFRTLWPSFDVEKDQKELWKAKNETPKDQK